MVDRYHKQIGKSGADRSALRQSIVEIAYWQRFYKGFSSVRSYYDFIEGEDCLKLRDNELRFWAAEEVVEVEL